MTQKKLIFHFGGPKTGSSALQKFLSTNGENLKKDKIFYRDSNKPHDEINSGNGYDLFMLLREGNYQEKELDTFVSGYLNPSGDGISICSSELFSFLEKQEIFRLLQSCDRLRVDYAIFYYVRAPAEYCISNYNQLVKRHGEFRPLEEYLESACWDHAVSLRRIDEIVADKNLIVRHYDKNAAADIVNSFFGSLDVALEHCSTSTVEHINRSFYEDELALMLSLNRMLGPRYSQTISDKVLEHNSAPKSNISRRLSPEVAKAIQHRFSADVEWINNVFLLGTGSFIKNELSTDAVPASAEHSDKDKNVPVERMLLLWAAAEIASSETSFLDRTRDTICSLVADRTLAASPEIPSDFNATLYLILNPDLIVNKVNPYFHYINFSKKEGRRCRIE